MSFKKYMTSLAIALPLLVIAASPAEAHRRWLLPSATVLSGQKEVVTVDAAASNGLFIFEHRPLGLEDLIVTGPDGKPVEAKIIGKGEYRSSFDVPLKQQGTYRIALVSSGLMGVYMHDGQRKRWRGSEAELATAFPQGASEIKVSQNASRVETFTTLGAPSASALAPTGKGLEMVPVTHPNDLVAGEEAAFKFLIDGKPAADMEVEWVEGGTRYRDDSGMQKLNTDSEGVLKVTATEPGLYYLEASISQDTANVKGADTRRASYTAVLEFLPL